MANAWPSCAGPSPGQSQPISTICSARCNASAAAQSSREPKSPGHCRCSATRCAVARSLNTACEVFGAHHSSSGVSGSAESRATVSRNSCSCSRAAPTAPRAGIMRVFACPGTGALAKSRMRAPDLVTSSIPGRRDRRCAAIQPNRNSRCHVIPSTAQRRAPPQLLPCPAVQPQQCSPTRIIPPSTASGPLRSLMCNRRPADTALASRGRSSI